MDAETLRREGQKRLFEEDLVVYQLAVMEISLETRTNKGLGDPQVVLDCLSALHVEALGLVNKWYTPMVNELSDDDHPDPEPSEDSGDVGLHTLTQGELNDWLTRAILALEELCIR